MRYNKDDYLRQNEVAELAGVSRTTIIRWVRMDTMPQPIRVKGWPLLWDKKTFDHWLKHPDKLMLAKGDQQDFARNAAEAVGDTEWTPTIDVAETADIVDVRIVKPLPAGHGATVEPGAVIRGVTAKAAKGLVDGGYAEILKDKE